MKQSEKSFDGNLSYVESLLTRNQEIFGQKLADYAVDRL